MRALILLSLVFFSFPVFAEHIEDHEGRICAPFRGGVVDNAILEKMLQANEEGRLFRIQPENSKIGFCVDSAIGRIEARFKEIQGGFALHRKVWGSGSQMLVMVDASSLAMNRNYLKDMLKGEHFLDTYTYPKILFVSTRLRWINHKKAVLEGMLTMHGVTRPVSFDVSMTLLPGRNPQSSADVIVTATAYIRRKDFDMHNLAFLVDDTVELCMRVEASLFNK